MSSRDIIELYDTHVAEYDSERGRSLIEKVWLDRFLQCVPTGGTVLDIGCGMGQPIASYLLELGFNVVGVDSSRAMISLCRRRYPQGDWVVADMRDLDLDRRFDGLIAWDSFFHLSMDDQRGMFARFAEHANPNAPLLFTSGPAAGESIGSWCGKPLYHASLDAAEYRELLAVNGFAVQRFEADDASCGGHTVWLATRGR
jgi:2-polyprenyl-3-methyl-5-hydroxy-6-metoxy-1,4-benzoquinol methylase